MIAARMIGRFATLSLLTATALAQGAVAPNRFVPAGAHMVMRVSGPAVWHEQFAKTWLAKVFDGPTLAPWMKRARDGYESALDRAAERGMPREALNAFVKDYRGEIVMSAQFDFAHAAEHDDEAPRFAMMLAMLPDGRFDLAAFADAIRQSDAKHDTERTAVHFGDHTFQLSKGPEPDTLPEMVDGSLVVLFGAAVESYGAAMLDPKDRGEVPPAAPLSMHLRLGEAILEVAEHAADAAGNREQLQPMFDAMGLSQLGTIEIVVAPAGEHVAMETSVACKGGDPGLLGLVMPDRTKTRLLRHLPANVESFSLSAFDLDAGMRAVERFFTAAGEGGAESFAQMLDAFRDKTKVRLREDLLAHIGGELLLLGDLRSLFTAVGEATAEGGRPDPSRLFNGYCLGIELRDGKAVAESLDKMLRAVGLHAARKTEDYRDTKIHELRLGGALAIEYAVTDDLLLLVPGSRGNGNDYLRAVLDARLEGKGALPAKASKRIDDLPESWSGVSVTPIADLAVDLITFGEALAKQRGQRTAAEALDTVRGIAREMKTLGHGEITTVTYSSKKGLRTVYRW